MYHLEVLRDGAWRPVGQFFTWAFAKEKAADRKQRGETVRILFDQVVQPWEADLWERVRGR